MAKAKFKPGFTVSGKKDLEIRQSINDKFSSKIVEYPSVPRIGDWIDLLELSNHYNLSPEEVKWLFENEHKYRIENVNICDGFIEAELDTDKVWKEEAS